MTPIKTKAQHRAALARIEKLMDLPEPSPRQAVELDELSDAVQAYEDKHYPMGEPVYVRAKELFKLIYGPRGGEIFNALYGRIPGWRRLAKHVIALEREAAKWKDECKTLLKENKRLRHKIGQRSPFATGIAGDALDNDAY